MPFHPFPAPHPYFQELSPACVVYDMGYRAVELHWTVLSSLLFTHEELEREVKGKTGA